jgi:hypothetical protein
MSTPDPTPSRDVLERARACVRVDQRIVAALPELGEAIRSFEPVPGPAGESVAEWLVERALSEPREATVRVRLNHGKVAGVYALCAAQVARSREERAQLGGVHYRTQPAILLAQFARSDGSPGIGEEMLQHANRIARERSKSCSSITSTAWSNTSCSLSLSSIVATASAYRNRAGAHHPPSKARRMR